jgi:DNA-binding transcriptional regulator YiaG
MSKRGRPFRFAVSRVASIETDMQLSAMVRSRSPQRFRRRIEEATMSATTNVIAQTIEALRERGSLTGVDVANVVEVSKATVSR